MTETAKKEECGTELIGAKFLYNIGIKLVLIQIIL